LIDKQFKPIFSILFFVAGTQLSAEVTLVPGLWEERISEQSPFLQLIGGSEDGYVGRECSQLTSSDQIIANVEASVLPGEDCSLSNVSSTATQYEADFSCAVQHGMSSRGRIEYDFAPDRIVMTIAATVNLAGQSLAHNSTSTVKRVGDC